MQFSRWSRFILVVTAIVIQTRLAFGFGVYGLYEETNYRGARWSAAPRFVDGVERSLDGGIRYSLDGGSYENFRDMFQWQTTPSVEEFQEAIELSFAAWTVTDPRSKFYGMLTFTEDFSTPVENGNLVGSEIDIIARRFDSSGQRGSATLSWGIWQNMMLTSGVNYIGQPINGSDIEMNNHPDTRPL